MKLIAAIAVAAGLSTLAISQTYAAFGDPGQWWSGWGQGTAEYIAANENGGRLYIACEYDKPVSMSLSVNGHEYGSDSQGDFTFIIDGEEVPTPYETDSHVYADWFFYSWDALRKANSIVAVTSDGASVELPSSGSAQALPAAHSPEMPCKTGFYSF